MSSVSLRRFDAHEVKSALEKWYCAHAAIRHLKATDEVDGVSVVLTLEPTSDGDDAYPLWLANSDRWLTELTGLTRRQVRLHLIASPDSLQTRGDFDGRLIAEISWRIP